ncbi:MAG: RNA-binding protein [Lautropia sp.]|nr:RNA-binding protein [Lautropia sp.]
MSTKIYVGNLPWRTTDVQLKELFAAYGEVLGVRIVSDRETGRSRGFAFVTIANDEGARAAIGALNGYLLEGRVLVVSEANDQGPRPGSSRRPGGGRSGAGSQ